MTYDLLPVGAVLQCRRTGDLFAAGDLYTRLSDGEDRDWLAVYVQTAAMVVLDPTVRRDGFDLLATSELPAGLVLLAPATAAAPAPRPAAVVDLDRAMQTLTDRVLAPVVGVR